MDKIGIFKLLTSAFDFYQKNASKFSKPTEQTTTPFNNNKERENLATKSLYAKPLQEGMLSTMRSHDEFMNRVYKNNKKK